ncbi:MAG TPA: hypothetical protein VFA40_24315 [Terriglobales bacterium]|jgi:hypothetical protein|nr:hypothetical protein [Terriglobales bacterium]
MKRFLVLLPLVVSMMGCGMNSVNRAAPDLQPVAKSTSIKTYDMLAWMTMQSDLSSGHHMAGSANPLYTSRVANRLYWTKTAAGFPWDIQLFDSKYVYLWVTELDWQNPRTFKVFHSPTLGKYNLPLVPRLATAGYPGSTVKISDSRYEIHSDCNTFTTKNLGHVINEVWGPYKESLGGQLPNDLETLVISYRYSCDANYSNCANKEEFHVAKPYGLVKWQHQSLGADGAYKTPDNVTYFNRIVSGQTSPVTSCF